MDRRTLELVLNDMRDRSTRTGSIDAKIAYNEMMIMVTQLILKTYDK